MYNVVFHHMEMDGRRWTVYRFKFIMEMISHRAFRVVVVRVSQTHLILCALAFDFIYIYYVYGEIEIMTFNVECFFLRN